MSVSENQFLLTGQAMLTLWDRGYRQTPAERAITILDGASPNSRTRHARELSIGQRDRELVRLYADTFGERATAVARCGNCGELLDLSFSVYDLLTESGDGCSEWQIRTGTPPYDVRYRLPSSEDVGRASRAPSAKEARQVLLERCVLAAECEGMAIPPRELPEEVLVHLGKSMVAHDPQSDVRLQTICPACQAEKQVTFDIVRFVWDEIASAARRLLADVHALARAYGWSEADILALPAARREIYLELAEA